MGSKKKNSTNQSTDSEQQSKVSHKSKDIDHNHSKAIQKKSKHNMKNSLNKYDCEKKPPQRYTQEEIEQRRLYIKNTIIKGNQQFQEDLNSQWYSDHSTDEYSSSTPIFFIEIFKENSITCLESLESSIISLPQSELLQSQQNSNSCIFKSASQRHVSFSDGGEIHHLQVDRSPPGRDHPIFDTKKTWITQLMSKKPQKSSIKISFDRKGESNQMHSTLCIIPEQSEGSNLDLIQNHLRSELNIDTKVLIDNSTYRVLYEQDKKHYLVNTHFCYTQ